MGTTLYFLVLVVLSVLHPVHPSCPDSFIGYSNQYVEGGTLVSASASYCAEACMQSATTCHGYGIKDCTECYLVLFVHSGTTWSTSWDRYQRSSFNCQGSGSCEETYIAYEDQYVEGGTLVAASASGCADACVESASTCYGYGIKDGVHCYLVLFVHTGTTWSPNWDRWQRSTFNC